MNKGALSLETLRNSQSLEREWQGYEDSEYAGLVLTEFPGTPFYRAFQPLYEAEYQTHFTEGLTKAIFPNCPDPKPGPASAQ